MKALPLVLEPNLILRKKSILIDFNKNTINLPILAEQMIATMIANNGVGLAAPQVGKNIQLIVINKDVSKTINHLILCNPKITFRSAKTTSLSEGCLSCPGVFISILRPEKIRIKAVTLDNKKIVFKAKGLLAKAFQHEIDHLNGILIIDKNN